MKEISIRLRSMSRYTAFPVLAALGIGLVCSVATLYFLQKNADSQGRTELTMALSKLQASFSTETTRSRTMGAAMLLGLNEPVLKKAALGEYAQDAPEVLERLNITRKIFSAESVLVLDRNGLVVANDTDGKRSTGKNVAFRPYFQQAIHGQENVYAAIGTNSDSRGLYFAAPLHEGTTQSSMIIGVVVIKMAGEPLDSVLGEVGGDSLVISPQGVVFASSRPEWLFAMTPPFSEKRVEKIQKLQQFGKQFDDRKPFMLAFDPDQPTIMLDGNRYIAERITLAWKDPAGEWTTILMRNADHWFSYGEKVKITVSILLTTLIVGIIIQLQLKKLRLLNRRLESENAERSLAQQGMLAEAERRSTIANVISDLRQADDLSELAQIFIRHASTLLDVRYGLFYVANESNRTLKLIGGFGLSVDNVGWEINFGEGLAGQCAVEGKTIQLDMPPADYIKITSGTGSAAPACILFRPLILNEHLIGVLELAAFRSFDNKDLALLTELEPILATSVQVLGHNRAIEDDFVFQQALLDTIPYPVFYKGPDTRFLGFNRAYEEVFSVSRENLIGKRVLDLKYLPEADRIAYQAEDERVIAEVSSVQREMPIPFADGEMHNTLYFVSGFRRADGSPGGLVGTFIDISDRYKKE